MTGIDSPGAIETAPLNGSAPGSVAAPPGTVLLEVKDVSVNFGRFTAVRNATFSLRAGSILGLIGPNGAGKTTLLRAIVSLQAISSGTIRLLGGTVTPGDEDAARIIGFTPDVPPHYEGLTVFQFLNLIAAGYGLTAENTGPTIDFWLEKVWLADKKNQKIKALSRGMKQRLGIARTLLPNPQVILLDEPASGLDPAGRVQFRRLLSDLRDQGKALIVSSHILSDMDDYCTHIAIMSHGAIIRFGTVREISEGIDDGRCRYTLHLSEPMAGVEGTLAAIPEVEVLQVDRMQVTLRFSSDRARAAGLLREILNRNVPVCGFLANTTGLEEAYLQADIKQVD